MNSTEKAWEIAELKEENRRLETDNKNLREENLRMLKLVNEKIAEAHEQTERAEKLQKQNTKMGFKYFGKGKN